MEHIEAKTITALVSGLVNLVILVANYDLLTSVLFLGSYSGSLSYLSFPDLIY